MSTAAIQTTLTIASGGGSPVSLSGSALCELIIFRIKGSQQITIMDPTPMPQKARPESPGDQPRMSEKMIGYATKQRYNTP